MAIPLKGIVLAAAVGAVVVLAGTPSYVYADALVASFASGSLENPQGAGRLLPRYLPILNVGSDRNAWIGFAPADSGSGTVPRRGFQAKARPHRLEANVVAGRKHTWNRSMMLAALTLIVGDVPGMPQMEGPDPVSVITGLTDTGGSQSSGSGSPSAPATPEPTALLSGLLGFGFLGAFVLVRWGTTLGDRGVSASC